MLSPSSARVSERVIWEIIGQACRGRGPFARGSGRPPAAIRQAPFKASIGIAKKTVNLPWRTREGCIIGFDVNRTRTALGCAARNNTLRNWTITIDLPAYLYLPACLRTHRPYPSSMPWSWHLPCAPPVTPVSETRRLDQTPPSISKVARSA